MNTFPPKPPLIRQAGQHCIFAARESEEDTSPESQKEKEKFKAYSCRLIKRTNCFDFPEEDVFKPILRSSWVELLCKNVEGEYLAFYYKTPYGIQRTVQKC